MLPVSMNNTDDFMFLHVHLYLYFIHNIHIYVRVSRRRARKFAFSVHCAASNTYTIHIEYSAIKREIHKIVCICIYTMQQCTCTYTRDNWHAPGSWRRRRVRKQLETRLFQPPHHFFFFFFPTHFTHLILYIYIQTIQFSLLNISMVTDQLRLFIYLL